MKVLGSRLVSEPPQKHNTQAGPPEAPVAPLWRQALPASQVAAHSRAPARRAPVSTPGLAVANWSRGACVSVNDTRPAGHVLESPLVLQHTHVAAAGWWLRPIVTLRMTMDGDEGGECKKTGLLGFS